MSDDKYRALDLFCGLGGFSAAFADADRWAVTTVDIEGRFEPDIEADVFELRPSDFEREFDVVLASPPCTQFSIAASRFYRFENGEPQTEDAADALALVHHTVGLIRGLAPTYWLLENPVGKLRQVWRAPNATLTQCQYGRALRKPTDLWGDVPPAVFKTCSPGDDCHDSEPRGMGSGENHVRDPAERAKVPYELSDAIREACEAGLDGETSEQATLNEVMA
jgi:hypothetical protein